MSRAVRPGTASLSDNSFTLLGRGGGDVFNAFLGASASEGGTASATGNLVAVDYAIPCVALVEVAAVLLMMLVNRMNWQSYFMYQITITFLSFVPLIFWKIGWTHHPLLTVLAAGVSVAALAATVILGDRSVKRELKRRFHV